LSYDIKGSGIYWYRVLNVLNSVRVLPTSIPLYEDMPWMNEYGFAVKCDSGEYFMYNHCVSNTKVGQRFKKDSVIGRLDTYEAQITKRIKWINPLKKGLSKKERDTRWAKVRAFTGRHCHEVFIGTDGKTQLNFVKYLPVGTKMNGIIPKVRMDGYIYTWLKNYK
jgi:hypothetical protein